MMCRSGLSTSLNGFLILLQDMLQKELRYLIQINSISKEIVQGIFQDLYRNLADLWNLNSLNLLYLNRDNKAITSIPGQSPEIDLVRRKTMKFENAFKLYSRPVRESLFQQVQQLIRGDHELAYSHNEEMLNREIISKIERYSVMNDYTLGVLTWNLAGGKDYSLIDAKSMIKSTYSETLPDIFIMGFQETCELNFFSVVMFGHSKSNNTTIQTLFLDALNQIGMQEAEPR